MVIVATMIKEATDSKANTAEDAEDAVVMATLQVQVQLRPVSVALAQHRQTT